MKMKTYVRKHMSGISNRCSIPGPRLVQFLACGMAVTGQALQCIGHLKAGRKEELSREEIKMLQKTLCDGLRLMKKGFRHEITIANVVEEEGWGQVKHYEGHERIGRDERKRLDHVRQFRRAEDKKKGQAAKKTSSSSASQSKRRNNNRGGNNNSGSSSDKPNGKDKLTCFYCQLPGHIANECKLKKQHESSSK